MAGNLEKEGSGLIEMLSMISKIVLLPSTFSTEEIYESFDEGGNLCQGVICCSARKSVSHIARAAHRLGKSPR
jgi:hypothetical protein